MSYFYTDCQILSGQVAVRGYRNGQRFQDRSNYEPYIFLPGQGPSPYKTLDNRPVVKKDFSSVSTARQFLRDHKDIDGFDYYGMTNFEYLYINDEFSGEIDYVKKDITILSIDIELYIGDGFPVIAEAKEEITAVTISNQKTGKVYCLGTKYYKPKLDNVTYILCENERELLKRLIQLWVELDPDIITGWNVEKFDIPYIINRITNVLGEDAPKKLSPWRRLEMREVPSQWGQPQQVWDIVGVATLDYMDLYKKFSYKNQESYKLDHIAFVELGEKKLDYSEYRGLNDLYDRNPELYYDYNIHDSLLVDRLEMRLGFINIVISMAYLYKCNYNDTLATVKPWDVCIHHFLLKDGYVIPQYKRSMSTRGLVGGYVKDIIPRKHKWVVSFDIKSSYPHQIMQYNISPETYIRKLGRDIVNGSCDANDLIEDLIHNDLLSQYRSTIEANDLSVAGNLTCYARDRKGFMPEIMEQFFGKRAEYSALLKKSKKEYDETKNEALQDEISRYNAIQLALKIAINSFYGSIANEYCRWFSIDFAEAITMSGQLAVRWVENRINVYLNKLLKTDKFDYIIAIDTDSNYIVLDKLVDKLGITDREKIIAALEKFCNEHLQEAIKRAFEDLATYMNAYENRIRMAREVISSSAIWTAKKHYILNLDNYDGKTLTPPELKMVGVEAVKSSIPMLCKKTIKEAFEVILSKDEDALIEYVDNFREEFKQKPFIEVASPSSVNGIKKYSNAAMIYNKGTPIHVRASLLYNHLIRKNNLESKYPLISDGDKIKYCYLKLPNPINENIIATPTDGLPEEFGLTQFVDYTTQFEKTFINPVKSITDVIDWKLEKVSTLASFFS